MLVLILVAMIDKPKIDAEATPKKYAAVYYTILSLAFIFSALDIFKILPHYDEYLIDIYKKIFKLK
jgi:hypothetical protein